MRVILKMKKRSVFVCWDRVQHKQDELEQITFRKRDLVMTVEDKQEDDLFQKEYALLLIFVSPCS